MTKEAFGNRPRGLAVLTGLVDNRAGKLVATAGTALRRRVSFDFLEYSPCPFIPVTRTGFNGLLQ